MLEQLIQTGSAVAILAAIVIAFYTGRVGTKASFDNLLKTVTDMWAERFADERAEKEAWKAQAQQLAPAVEQIAAELEEANERDEVWKRALTTGANGVPERRQV